MVTDAYPPMRTSCAVQMHDLAQAFLQEGHQATIITPNSQLKSSLTIDWQEGVQVIQVKALESKDVNYVRRILAEFINPFLIWRALKKDPQFSQNLFNGIIWYSPTIFWGPLIKRLKKQFQVKSYLILRDIFPDWAFDLGLIKKGLTYQFLKSVERFQYAQADLIGVQSPNNLRYFQSHHPQLSAKVEVLWNWIGASHKTSCPIDLSQSPLAGRKIFIYAGNMGVAQGISSLIELARNLAYRNDIGFVFVGRGNHVENLKSAIKEGGLTNTLFFDEIEPSQIPSLYAQCFAGLITLDPRHKTQNIPGKFLTYLQSGLPIFAMGNSGNDLESLIAQYQLGIYIDINCKNNNLSLEDHIIEFIEVHQGKLKITGREYLLGLFSAKKAVIQILENFQIH